MSKVLAIAAREVNERRFIIQTAVLLGVLPFAALLLRPLVTSFGRGAVLGGTAAFVAANYVFALALVLGASVVAREAAEKRLSFYFSKPVSEVSIWVGKVLGGLATLALVSAIIIVPALLAGIDQPQVAEALGFFALTTVALFLVSHAIATMVRSRSPLILADAIALAVVALLLNGMWNVLIGGLAFKLLIAFAWALGISLLIILAMAGAWQLSRGRGDLRRSHFELSRFLWSGIGIVIAIAGAVVLWITSVTPEQLDHKIIARQVPHSNWVVIQGSASGRSDYKAAFLQNALTGDYRRIEGGGLWWDAFFTRDGRAGGRVRADGTVEMLRFDGRNAELLPSNLHTKPGQSIVASDDGTRVAVISREAVRVATFPEGRTLAVAQIAAKQAAVDAFFVSSDVVRLILRARNQLEVFELDVRTKQLVKTGSFAAADGTLSIVASPDGSRLLVRLAKPERNELLVLDGRTAAVIGQLRTDAGNAFGVPLSDGRIVAVKVKNGAVASIYGPDLVLQRQVPLPELTRVLTLHELAGGKVVIGGRTVTSPDPQRPHQFAMHVVDLQRGAIVRTDPRFVELWYDELDPRATVVPPNAPVIKWDAGKLRRIVL